MSGFYWLWLFAVQSIWAASYIGMKVCVREMPVATVVFIRYGIVSLVFLSFWIVKGFPAFQKKDWLWLAGLGAANFALAPFLQVYSLTLTQAVDASIMIAMEPMITVFIAAIAIREKPKRSTVMAMMVATLGMFVLSGGHQTAESSFHAARFLGNMIFLLSLFCEASVTVAGRGFTGKGRPFHLMGVMMVSGFLTGSIVHAPTIARTSFVDISMTAWSGALFLALGCSLFSYTAWYWVLQRVPVHHVSLSLFVQPIVGSLLGWSLLGEKLGWNTLTGASIILLSLGFWQGIVYRKRKRKLVSTT